MATGALRFASPFFHSSAHSLCSSFQRPLLVILDRSTDLASLLHHTWTYQALAHDVLVKKFERFFSDTDVSFLGFQTKSSRN